MEPQQNLQLPDNQLSVNPLEDSNSALKNCNCKKTKCLKMYCECFGAGNKCSDACGCLDCGNNGQKEEKNKKNVEENKSSQKSCNCKKSECLKKYCECFSAKQACNQNCKCQQCKNLNPLINDGLSAINVSESEQEAAERSRQAEQFTEKAKNLVYSVPEEYRKSLVEFLFYVLT